MHDPKTTGTANEKPAPVLLVEDNPTNQKVTVLLLERFGLEVKLANNGKEAVEAVSREKFSVILMDCHMPEMDGFEATQAIRKLQALSAAYTPIIALTALAMAGDRERCIASGMDDYIPKPIDKELLKIKLNHWLRQEVVYQQHKLTHKILHRHPEIATLERQPIDLVELADFYGEEQVSQIVGVFVDSTQQVLKQMASFAKTHDAKAIAGLAHELRSSAASVGAKQLARLSLYLEQAVGQQDWPEAEETLDSLRQCFGQCQEYILSDGWRKE